MVNLEGRNPQYLQIVDGIDSTVYIDTEKKEVIKAYDSYSNEETIRKYHALHNFFAGKGNGELGKYTQRQIRLPSGNIVQPRHVSVLALPQSCIIVTPSGDIETKPPYIDGDSISSLGRYTEMKRLTTAMERRLSSHLSELQYAIDEQLYPMNIKFNIDQNYIDFIITDIGGDIFTLMSTIETHVLHTKGGSQEIIALFSSDIDTV